MDKNDIVCSVTYRIGSSEITVERSFAGDQPLADRIRLLLEEQLRHPSGALSRTADTPRGKEAE